jgi:hypothetical protein
MRGWMVALLGGAAALLLALSLRSGGDVVADAGAPPASPVSDRAGFSSTAAPPRLPGDTAAPAAGGVDVDALIRRHQTESDAALDEQLAAIDGEIASRRLIEQANAGPLSPADEAALRGLLQRRNAVNVTKARRLIARLEALAPASRAEVTP